MDKATVKILVTFVLTCAVLFTLGYGYGFHAGQESAPGWERYDDTKTVTFQKWVANNSTNVICIPPAGVEVVFTENNTTGTNQRFHTPTEP